MPASTEPRRSATRVGSARSLSHGAHVCTVGGAVTGATATARPSSHRTGPYSHEPPSVTPRRITTPRDTALVPIRSPQRDLNAPIVRCECTRAQQDNHADPMLVETTWPGQRCTDRGYDPAHASCRDELFKPGQSGRPYVQHSRHACVHVTCSRTRLRALACRPADVDLRITSKPVTVPLHLRNHLRAGI